MASPKPIDKYEKLASVWDKADSLKHACKLAGINGDARQRLRVRRSTEATLGIELPAHNPQHSVLDETICPSTLDLKAARKAKGYVAFGYMNNAELIGDFLTTLELFSTHHKLQILAKPLRYKNPNSNTKSEEYYWDERIYPYVINKDFHINSSVVFSAVSLQATTANPLSGKQYAYGKKSVIYGSPCLELDSVASPSGELPKLLFTTGCINKPRYSNSNVGIKAAAKHSVSALVILPVSDYFRDYIIEWDGIGFTFFDEYWTPEGLSDKPAIIKAIHFGDAHANGVTEKHIKPRERLIKKLNPEYLIWNDLHNHAWQSHHLTRIQKMKLALEGKFLVKDEVEMSIQLLNRMGKGRKNIIVRSNHHDHIEQWMNKFNPDHDPHNSQFYHDIMHKMSKSDKCALELAMEEGLKVDYEFVDGDKPKLIAGVDVAQHGDKGPDGARSGAGYYKVYSPIQAGHTHKRFIKCNYWTSGVIPLYLGYNVGYGSWSQTDTIITDEGTRSHVTLIKGKFWK